MPKPPAPPAFGLQHDRAETGMHPNGSLSTSPEEIDLGDTMLLPLGLFPFDTLQVCINHFLNQLFEVGFGFPSKYLLGFR